VGQERGRKRLFESTPVDDEVVAATLSAAWPGARLGARLKSSQNVTYAGELADGQVSASYSPTSGHRLCPLCAVQQGRRVRTLDGSS
jgi:hypothetical protein